MSTMFRSQARDAWRQACGNFDIAPELGMELQFRPVAARATQPRIDTANISLEVGIDAHTSIGTGLTEPECTSLTGVAIEDEIPDIIEFIIPATVGYEQLDSALTSNYVDRELGSGVVATIESISVRPIEGSLLLTAEVFVREEEWFGARAKGTVYIVAEPRLDTDAQVGATPLSRTVGFWG